MLTYHFFPVPIHSMQHIHCLYNYVRDIGSVYGDSVYDGGLHWTDVAIVGAIIHTAVLHTAVLHTAVVKER